MEDDILNRATALSPKNKVLNAATVWLLMGKEYRISRSIRLQWFFEHLNQEICKKSDEDITNSGEELEVLAVIPEQSDPQENSSYLNDGPLVITPTTKLSFVGRQYRFVFCIDMSPSLATVDTETGNVLFDDMFTNLQNCFKGLVQPFSIPGSLLTLKPSLHVTVIAHTYIRMKECQVVVQGYCVNESNVNFFLCRLKRKIQVLERSVAEELTRRNKVNEHDSSKMVANRNETSLFYIIRDGLFALQLLPNNASAAIIVVTDGVFQFDNALVSEALLQQVRQLAAVCAFLQVGTGFRRSSVQFGYVPHCALMQFIATATSGAYLARCPPVKKTKDDEMNIYHKALFCWNFQRDVDSYKIDSRKGSGMYLSSWADCSGYSTCSHKDCVTMPAQQLQTTNYNEDGLHTKIASVLALRSREGYITDSVRITKSKLADGKQIEVKLVLPWKEHVTIEYIARASWPFDSASNYTNIAVNVSGPYEFLVDITSTKPKSHRVLRKTVLQQFDQTMKSLEMSDRLLVQLQLFPSHLVASRIPATIAKDSSLFCMSPNSNTPILALQYGSKIRKSSKAPEVQFANYWKSIISLDTRALNKWFHVHRITLLPEHDRPIPNNLMIPTAADHYIPVHSRGAMSAFFRLLKEWCSFILLESHSYIKFMSRSAEERPYTFCLLRVNFKGLCIVIKVAFLGGTPGAERSKAVEALKEELRNLKAPIQKLKDEAMVDSTSQPEHCIIFLAKQFEMILVKYDSIPEQIRLGKDVDKITAVPLSADYRNSPKTQSFQPLQNSPDSVYSQYLFNQRWVWKMNLTEYITLEERSIALILQTIIAQRLHEGFHFSDCNKGIVSLVKEVQVTVDASEENMSNCSVIQYVVFPPHNKLTAPSLAVDESTDSENGMHENDGQLQMATEIWVEPQLGTMDEPNCPLDYINGVEYNHIPRKMFAVDVQIVEEISSYMMLHKSCLDKSIAQNIPSAGTTNPDVPNDIYCSALTLHIPFQFSVLPLVKKSHLIVSMYPMMKNTQQLNLPAGHRNQNDILLMYLHQTMRQMTDHTLELHDTETKRICNYVRERVTENNTQIWGHDLNAPIFKAIESHINLTCYIKSFGSRIMIMFTFNTVEDLNLVLESPQEGIARDASSLGMDLPMDPQAIGRTHLPFFIFECEFQLLQTVPSQPTCFNRDVLQDYTQVLTESALTPRHLNQKLPEDRSRELAIYCQALYDRYFWSFVGASYNCLQNGYVLDPEDVELSIELVCEESIQEIDVTNFMRTICSHYRSNTLDSDIFQDDIVFPESSQVLFQNSKLQARSKKGSGSSDSSSSQISSSRTSGKARFKECENEVLQKDIQAEFMRILEQHFQKVPNDPYYMFFSKSKDDSDGSESGSDDGPSSSRSSVSQSENCFGDAELASNSGVESDNPFEDVKEERVGKNRQRPMFLHLTCSCHYKTNVGNTIRPLSVTTLPTCLGDILSRLDDSGRGIDPSNPSLQITLDLICLTQPMEPEEGSEWKTPKDVVIMRQNSSDSFFSVDTQGSDKMKRARVLSQVSQSESYGMKNETNDGLQGLPATQRQAMEKAVKEIEWLLEDEIASALRTQGPVTEDVLDKVAKHVRESDEFDNCIFERQYFMFVTGIEKASDHCLPLFICELESARLDRYELTRYGKYYCLVLPPNQEAESDGESIVEEAISKSIAQIKEEAQKTRKHLGHRRSQSDFTNNRLAILNQVQNEEFVTSKSHSLPSVNFSYFTYAPHYQPQSVLTAADVSGSLWEEAVQHSGKKVTTKSSSTASELDDDRLCFQRSMSYTDHDLPSPELMRRRFSMPNIYSTKNNENLEELSTQNVTNRKIFQIGSFATLKTEVAECQTEDDYRRPHPDFWLFTNISEESVDVYLHRRRAETIKNSKYHKSIYNRLLVSMDQICKIVNQRILLDNLHSTNQCHNLLIPEDDEHIWDRDERDYNDILFIQGPANSTQPFNAHVHGEYKFHPGYFQCDCVWKAKIPIHRRLTGSAIVGESSKGLIAVRKILAQFSVSNRRNLFVIKENGNVFYFRVHEGTSDQKRGLDTTVSPLPDDDRFFAPVREEINEHSRATSMTSLINKPDENRFGRFEFERQESYQSGQFIPKYDDRTSASETSLHHQSQHQEFVNLSVYGIREPGGEIKQGMVNMITNKLDDIILALINQSLSRNNKCKLSLQDVQFIQPIGKLPAKILHFCVSTIASQYLHSIMFYLQQHLLQVYNIPRFLSSDNESHFKNYARDKPTALTAEPIAVNDLLLYNRNDTAGKGIGIIFLNLVNQDGINVMAQPCYPSMNYESTTMGSYKETLENLLVVKNAAELSKEDNEMCQNIQIEFKIWERGDIDVDSFDEKLLRSIQYALCDVFLEYHVFCTPISFVPKLLQSSRPSSRRGSLGLQTSLGHMRDSSGSSCVTTPKSVKPHLALKQFNSDPIKQSNSEPATPCDIPSESVATGIKAPIYVKAKDDLSLGSQSSGSFPKDSLTRSSELCVEEIENRRKLLAQGGKQPSPVSARSKREESPIFAKKKVSREDSPLVRKRSASSRTSSVHSENELPSPSPDSNKTPKTISMKELNQLKLPVGTSYVMLSDAEIQESLKAIEGENEKKSQATWQELEVQRRLELDRRKDSRKHEHGGVGDLHTNYVDCAPDLFDSIIERGDCSLHKQTGTLTHQYPINFVIKEFMKEMNEKCPDINPKIYKRVTRRDSDDNILTFYPVFQERTAVKSGEDNETSMDTLSLHQQQSIIPNQQPKFIIIGHNSHKWLLSMGTNEAELSDEEEGRTPLEIQSKQRFDPLIPPNPRSSGQDRRKVLNDLHPPSCIACTFVPRQKFFMALFENKQVTLYTYNFSSDIVIDKQLKRLYAWHNVRSHLNACLFMQKLGLFHHKHFVRDCPNKDDSDVASFASSSNRNHLVPLMKEISPKAKEKNKPEHDHGSLGVKIPEFDNIFRDTCPSRPLHSCNYFTLKDLVKRQAYQYQDVRNIKLHIAHKEARLKEIYDGWKQEGAHIPITEDRLSLLKKHSRFIHYCDAPIMFKVNDDRKPSDIAEIVKKEEGKKAGDSYDETDGSRMKGLDKEDWYEELKWILLQQYIQYLQTLGLCVVHLANKNTTPAAPLTPVMLRSHPAQRGRGGSSSSSRASNRSSDGKDFSLPEIRPTCYYLQKTSVGGIILIEVYFKKVFLCFKILGFESIVLRNTYISRRDQRHFLEDCNKFKDLTHLRSFTYDFHLRQLQDHLSGRHSVFQQGYPVHKLMEKVLTVYAKAPKFCRCKLTEGSVSLPASPGLTPNTVFRYLISNASVYGLSRICVSTHDNPEMDGPRDFVLTFNISAEKQPLQFVETWRTRRDVTEYDGNVTLYFDTSNDDDIVMVPFFLVLRNKKEFYPRPHMMSSVSSLKRRQRTESGAEIATTLDETVKQKARVRFSGPNDSTESVITAVPSTANLKRMPSWSAQEGKGSLSSIRSSGSDTSISRGMVFLPRSPGKTNPLNTSPVEHITSSPDFSLSFDVMQKTTSNSTSTQENYLLNEQKFLTEQVLCVCEKLKKKIGTALSNCWRDLMWLDLLTAHEEITSASKRSKRSKPSGHTQQDFAMLSFSKYVDDWKGENSLNLLRTTLATGISFNQLKLMFELVTRINVNEFDSRIPDAFMFLQAGTQQEVIRNLQSRFGLLCRQFICEEGDITYLCVLNPGNLDMLFLVEANESNGSMEFSIVYRKPTESKPFECKEETALKLQEKNSRNHIEQVITCLCSNIWQQMLPS